MKGDFSRSTFDPHKHYTSVRMQQGRVQVDADWNEQADILLHLITTQLQDLLGPAGTTVTEPGFKITLVKPDQESTPVELEEKPADQDRVSPPEESTAPAPGVAITPDGSEEKPADQGPVGPPEEPTAPATALSNFWIGTGRYYVDGILCENEEDVLFSNQLDYPAAASGLQGIAGHDHVLVYLDVWQRHITTAEDPAIREIALGGPDTTTRVKTVWQVKLLPLSGEQAGDQGWREGDGLRSLADWQEFVKRATDNGCLQAKWQEKGAFLENRLYRVEIHSISGDEVTFKWSRENGSVVFPFRPGAPVPVQDSQGRLCVTVEGLNRDPYQLQEGFWVEIVDDGSVLNGRPLPLCRVEEVDRQKGEVKLHTEEMDRILGEIARGLRHPLLRRWEDNARAVAPQWYDLEHGIQVCFSEKGAYQVGDYWLIPARANLEDGIEWPQKDGEPLALAPQGVVHHYAPLALLQSEGGEWHVIPDDAARFATLPQVEAHLNCVDGDLGNHGDNLADLDHRVTDSEERLAGVDARLEEHAGISANLDHRVKVLEERQTDFRELLVQYFQVADEIAVGHVVSVVPPEPSDEPEDELKARLASAADEDDRRLVVGVVRDMVTGRDEGQACRVVSYGRARCRVVGNVEPGDVLVPSKKPGYAQKAGRAPQPGTMLGKALGWINFDAQVMEELEDGKRLGQIDTSKRTGTVDMMVLLG